MKTINVLFLLLGCTLLGCTKYHDFERRLAETDTLMLTYPDSAYRLLCAMNGRADSVPTALRMRHLLLRSNAQNKSDVLFTSDSVGRLLTAYYDLHGSPNERMLAHYMQGCAYRDMQDWPSAVRCFNAAVAAADTAAADCNFEQLSIIYGQIAVIHAQQYLHDEALQAYGFAERYAQDTLSLLNIWEHKANTLIHQGKIDEGLALKELAAKHYQSLGYTTISVRAKGPCIKWYALQGNISKAEQTIDEYERYSGFFSEKNEIEPGKESYYYTKGIFFREKGDLDSAAYYFRKLDQLGRTVNDHYLAALGLAELYRSQQQTDSVAKYAWQTFELCDTLYNTGAAENLQQVQAIYNYSRHQENAHRKEQEARNAKIRLQYSISVSIAILLAIALTALLIRRRLRLKWLQYRRKVRARLTKNSAALAELNRKIDEKSGIIAFLNQQLNENAADHEENKTLKETIRILEQQISKHQQDIHTLTQSQHATRLEKEPTIVRFLEMAKQREERPSKEDRQRVCALVEEHYPGIMKLKEKNLSPMEYHICVLRKMGMDLQSIQFVEDISSNNLTNIRSRLHEKVFGTKGGARDFDRRLAEI